MEKEKLNTNHFAAIHRAIMAAKFPDEKSNNSSLLFSKNLKEALQIIQKNLEVERELKIEDYQEVLTYIISEIKKIKKDNLSETTKHEIIQNSCYPFTISKATEKMLLDSFNS